MLAPTFAPPSPVAPTTRTCVTPGSIGGSAPYGAGSATVVWTPGNTDGLNGSNPASYNDDPGSTSSIPWHQFRARGWRLQARVTANVTTAGGKGPAGHFISASSTTVSALWTVPHADGTYTVTGAWVDILPSSALTTIDVYVQTTREAGGAGANITYNSGQIEFQWVNP